MVVRQARRRRHSGVSARSHRGGERQQVAAAIFGRKCQTEARRRAILSIDGGAAATPFWLAAEPETKNNYIKTSAVKSQPERSAAESGRKFSKAIKWAKKKLCKPPSCMK
jgi:hypothetical protein